MVDCGVVMVTMPHQALGGVISIRMGRLKVIWMGLIVMWTNWELDAYVVYVPCVVHPPDTPTKSRYQVPSCR